MGPTLNGKFHFKFPFCVLEPFLDSWNVYIVAIATHLNIQIDISISCGNARKTSCNHINLKAGVLRSQVPTIEEGVNSWQSHFVYKRHAHPHRTVYAYKKHHCANNENLFCQSQIFQLCMQVYDIRTHTCAPLNADTVVHNHFRIHTTKFVFLVLFLIVCQCVCV